MSHALQALGVLLPALYLATAFLYGMYFGGPAAPDAIRPGRIVGALALVTHMAWFLVRAEVFGGFPISGPWSTLSAVAFGVALLSAITSLRNTQTGVGLVVFGAAALLQLTSSAFAPLVPEAEAVEPATFYLFHALTSVAAASALVLSGLHGLLYLIVYRQMRHRRFGPIVRRLPSLRTLARLMRRAALAGFLLLTVGINVGIGFAHAQAIEGFRYTDPVVLVLLALWIHFGIVAFSHKIPGFSAQRASYAAAAGLTVLLAISVVALIPEVSFHWRGGRG